MMFIVGIDSTYCTDKRTTLGTQVLDGFVRMLHTKQFVGRVWCRQIHHMVCTKEAVLCVFVTAPHTETLATLGTKM